MFGPYPGSLMLFHLGENTAASGGWAGKLSPNPTEQAKNNSGFASEMRVIATCYLIVKQVRSHGQ